MSKDGHELTDSGEASEAEAQDTTGSVGQSRVLGRCGVDEGLFGNRNAVYV